MADCGRVVVMHVVNRLSLTGGAETSLVQLLPHLAALGIDNHVVTLYPHSTGSRVGQAEAAGARVTQLDAAHGLVAAHRLRRVWRDDPPDLVHAVLHDAMLAARSLGALRKQPVVVSAVNTPYVGPALTAYGAAWKVRAYQAVDRWQTQHLTAEVHAISRAAAEHAQQHLGADPDRTVVIPRARDRELIGEPGPVRRARVREALGLAPGAPLVLNVARQERQKAQHLLVEAFASLLREVPGARLVLAGRPGANTPALEDAVRRHRLEDAVTLLGARDDVPDLLSAADVFAFSSLFEGLGGAVLEAMAMQVPVVSFDVPAVAEALGGTGVLVPVGDVGGLASALAHTLADPEGASARAAAARKRFDTEFEVGPVAERMAQWYRSVAASAR